MPHNEDTRATFDKIRFEKKSDPKERKKERKNMFLKRERSLFDTMMTKARAHTKKCVCANEQERIEVGRSTICSEILHYLLTEFC